MLLKKITICSVLVGFLVWPYPKNIGWINIFWDAGNSFANDNS